MSDIEALEQELNQAIAAAGDEAALEAVRVAALGRKGSVSELLKSLGAMTPDERRQHGPQINGLKDRITAALATRKTSLAELALEARDVVSALGAAGTSGPPTPLTRAEHLDGADFATLGGGGTMKAGFDEMHDASGAVREHYGGYDRWLKEQPPQVMQRESG